MIFRDDLELRWRLLMCENEFSHITYKSVYMSLVEQVLSNRLGLLLTGINGHLLCLCNYISTMIYTVHSSSDCFILLNRHGNTSFSDE